VFRAAPKTGQEHIKLGPVSPTPAWPCLQAMTRIIWSARATELGHYRRAAPDPSARRLSSGRDALCVAGNARFFFVFFQNGPKTLGGTAQMSLSAGYMSSRREKERSFTARLDRCSMTALAAGGARHPALGPSLSGRRARPLNAAGRHHRRLLDGDFASSFRNVARLDQIPKRRPGAARPHCPGTAICSMRRGRLGPAPREIRRRASRC